MKYKEQEVLGITVIEVVGKLEGGPGASEFQEQA